MDARRRRARIPAPVQLGPGMVSYAVHRALARLRDVVRASTEEGCTEAGSNQRFSSGSQVRRLRQYSLAKLQDRVLP